MSEAYKEIVVKMTGTEDRWWPSCGWVWDTRALTRTYLRMMERRGLVFEYQRAGETAWCLTDDGRQMAKEHKHWLRMQQGANARAGAGR